MGWDSKFSSTSLKLGFSGCIMICIAHLILHAFYVDRESGVLNM